MPIYSMREGKVRSFGIERQVMLAVIVVSIFSLAYVAVYPYSKRMTTQASTTATTSATSLKTKVEEQDQPDLDHLTTVVDDDNASGFLNSTTTATPQNESQTNKTEGAYNLQASVTNKDPDSLNISVPRTSTYSSRLTIMHR